MIKDHITFGTVKVIKLTYLQVLCSANGSLLLCRLPFIKDLQEKSCCYKSVERVPNQCFGDHKSYPIIHEVLPQKVIFKYKNWICIQIVKLLLGRDKRAYIAALRQAKIYPPRQAAAATDRALWQQNLKVAFKGLRNRIF